MDKLHDALKVLGYTGHEPVVYLVRLLFCLYAEDTTIFEKRLTNLDESMANFPYVNDQLFAEPLPPTQFYSKMREALLYLCAPDWSLISPAIFDSLFQSIIDTDARRSLGARYNSEENKLKLIKPLFLDALWAEF